MDDQANPCQFGLSRDQCDRLSKLAEQASPISMDELIQQVRDHLEDTRTAYSSNRMVNVRLAAAIVETIETVMSRWDSLTAEHRNWLTCAFLYFSSTDDDEPDFESPIGFEDDTEVLNACLQFAELNDLCLNVEDYDDA